MHHVYIRDLTESAELSRQRHKLAGLASISRAFANIADPQQLTKHLVTDLAQLLGVEKCFLSRYEPVTDEVEALAPAYGIVAADLERSAVASLGQAILRMLSTLVSRISALTPRLTKMRALVLQPTNCQIFSRPSLE